MGRCPISPVSTIRPWAHAVQAINRKDLVELKSFKNPPQMCNVVLCAVCWLLTGEGSHDNFLQAKLSRAMMTNIGKFMRQLLEPPKITPEAYEQVDSIMKSYGSDFTPESVVHVSLVASHLTEWVTIGMALEKKCREFTNKKLPER